MALTITEDWVRERVQLKHSNLEDVRSLSLPGTYHEKINILGSALRSFSRLKHLDLSRNAIDSLQGVDNLKMLEKLNLYYNNISSLQELYRLRQNQKLQELDLRLNPVARNEPDYRLFLIHMLPYLRRLDDRAVRDTERKAALMHFTSDQAATIGEPPKRAPSTPEKQPNPRGELIKTLAKPVTVLDDDDITMLELIGRPGSEMGGITGSAASAPQIQEYTPESVRKMNMAGIGLGDQQIGAAEYEPPVATSIAEPYIAPTPIVENEVVYPSGTTAAWKHRWSRPSYITEALQQRYPNLPVIVATPPSPQHKDSVTGQEPGPRKNRVQFADDPNLKYQDEVEAYTSYKSRGQFTANPSVGGTKNDPAKGQQVASGQRPETAFGPNPHYPPMPPTQLSKTQQSVDYEAAQPAVEFYSSKESAQASDKNESGMYQELPSTHSVAPSTITNASTAYHISNSYISQEGSSLGAGDQELGLADPCNPFVSHVSNLVDRYWNGAKSLQTNQKFHTQLNGLLRNHLGTSLTTDSERDQRLVQLEEEVTRLRAENLQLRERGIVPPEIENSDEGKLKSMLIRAQRDLSILRSRLQMSMDENRGLHDRCASLEKDSSNVVKEGHTKVEELEQIRRENDTLRHEIGTMSGRMKQSGQLQELANMLQDSHKSLVQTNEHLLRELEETRTRHDQEVRQLHWSYDQLKTSVGYTPKSGNASAVLNGGGV